MLRRLKHRAVFVLIAASAAALSAPAAAETCDQLWQTRNAIFAEAGHCFKSPRAIATFGPRCYPPYGRLNRAQEARVDAIAAHERRLGCSSEPSSRVDIPPPPPAPPQDNTADRRLTEAASVWTATKDTTSPAILEAYISRFGDTPFGDLARARLDEVKKSPTTARRAQPEDASKEAGDQEMCPKYLPSVGRTVQAPCESYQFKAE